MKRIHSITALISIILLVGVTLATQLSADDLELPFWDFETDGTSENLIEDDGGFEQTLPVVPDSYIVSCIAPSHYPSFLTEVTVRVSNYFGQNTQIAVFTDVDGDGPDGAPVWTSSTLQLPHRQWYSRNLVGQPDMDIPITEGSWCMGFKQLDFLVFELHDSSSSHEHTWSGSPSAGWLKLDAIFFPGNGAFRGVAYYAPELCGCYIDDVCYAEGDLNPGNDCLVCDPDESVTDWTLNDGAICDDNIFCNGEDTCLSGVCSQHAGNPCPLDDGLYCNGTETFECIEATDECGHTGNPCPVDDGLFCNGDETAECFETTDECGHMGDPCEEWEECIEATDECVELADDDTVDDDTTDDDITDDDTADDDTTDDDTADDDTTDDDIADDDTADDDTADDDTTDDDTADDDTTDDDTADDDTTDDDTADDDTADDDTTDDDTADDDTADDDTGDDDTADDDEDIDDDDNNDSILDDEDDDDDMERGSDDDSGGGGCAC